MALFQVYVRDKNAIASDSPLWRNAISAANAEEAYQVGKAQFEMERPDLAHLPISIEAASTSVEK